nr:MAG TPA: hypothetical protein [Caudoviricetes sp.]
MNKYYQAFISNGISVSIEATTHDDNTVFNLTAFDTDYNKCRLENIDIECLKVYFEDLLDYVLRFSYINNYEIRKPYILSKDGTALGSIAYDKRGDKVIIVLGQFVGDIFLYQRDIVAKHIKELVGMLDDIMEEYGLNV